MTLDLLPRRFAYVFEFDRRGPPYSGTPDQQHAIRTRFSSDHGTPFDRVLHALAVSFKGDNPRQHIQLIFDQLEFGFAYTYPSFTVFRRDLHPGGVASVALHELGHLVDYHLLTPSQRETYLRQLHGNQLPPWSVGSHSPREHWARDFHDWVRFDDDSVIPAFLEEWIGPVD